MAKLLMPFGKHRGTPVAELPTDYLNWLLVNATLPSNLQRAVEAALGGEPDSAPRHTPNPSPRPTRHPDPDTPVKAWDYAGWAAARMRQGDWFPTFREPLRLKVLSPDEATLLGHLLNASRAYPPDESGWLYATPRFVEQAIGMAPEEQRRVLRGLEQRRIVDVQEGTGTGRFIRLRLARLDRLVRRAAGRRQRKAS